MRGCNRGDRSEKMVMGRKSLMMIGKTLWGPQETTYSFGIYLGLLWDLTGSFWDRAECLERNVLGLPLGGVLAKRPADVKVGFWYNVVTCRE